VRTGAVVSEPPEEPLRTYRVEVNDAGDILIALD
jgi:nitrite reductase/ring-hydroxylating ferredoxin subunit